MPKVTMQQLLDLGKHRLAELLMELAEQDQALEKRLRLLTATDADRLKQVRAQISGLKRTNRFFDWRSISKLKDKIEFVLTGISQLEVDPKIGFELVCSFYETDKKIFDNCDDSSGTVSDLYKIDARDLLIRFGCQCTDQDWLADAVYELNASNDYGVRDNVLLAACEFLSDSVVRKLIRRYQDLALSEDAASDTDNDWNRPSRRYWSAVQDLAEGIKDAPLFETALSALWGQRSLNAAAWNDIARAYLDAGDPQTALERLNNIDTQQNFQAFETEQIRLGAHAAIGGEENSLEIIRILRYRLFKSPSSRSFAELAERLSPKETKAVVDELVSFYEKQTTLNLGFLEFALSEIEPSVAQAYLLERADQIDGERYATLAPIAKQFAKLELPLASTLILRALADSILERGIAKNYKIAVGYIDRAAKLADKIEDWTGHPDHKAYVAALHANHSRKTAFWSKMK